MPEVNPFGVGPVNMLPYGAMDALFPWHQLQQQQALQYAQMQGDYGQQGQQRALQLAQMQGNWGQQAQQDENQRRLQIAQMAGSGSLRDSLASRLYARGLGPQAGFGSSFLGGAPQPFTAPNVGQMYQQFGGSFGGGQSPFGGGQQGGGQGGGWNPNNPMQTWPASGQGGAWPNPESTTYLPGYRPGEPGYRGPTQVGGGQPDVGWPNPEATTYLPGYRPGEPGFPLTPRYGPNTSPDIWPYGGTPPRGIIGGPMSPNPRATTGIGRGGMGPFSGPRGIIGGPMNPNGGGQDVTVPAGMNPAMVAHYAQQPGGYAGMYQQLRQQQQLASQFGGGNFNNLPALQQLQSGNLLPANTGMGGMSLPEFGIGNIPSPSQSFGTFRGLPEHEQRDVLDLWNAAGINPQTALYQMNSATPGFRQQRRTSGF